MTQENNKTINEILETVNFIKENAVTRDDLKRETDKLATKEELNGVIETVNFIKDKAATKQETNNLASKDDLRNEITLAKQEIKDEINQNIDEKITKAKNEIITKVDEFITLHQKLEQELSALQSKYNRLEGQMQKVLAHLQLQA
jgi:hypothetical protein